MAHHTRLKKWIAVFAGIAGCMVLAFLVATFLLVREIRQQVVAPILQGIADQLSDEATVRAMIVSKIISQDDIDDVLQEYSARLRNALASENVDNRLGAVVFLGQVGPDAAPFVPLLVDALDDDNPEIRRHAAYAVGEIGPDAAVALTKLRKMAAGEHARVQPEAAKAISKILEPPISPD